MSKAESIISEEESRQRVLQNKLAQRNNLNSKFNGNPQYVKQSRYTTEATRTDTKSYKQTYSRDNSLSSNRSGCFSKK